MELTNAALPSIQLAVHLTPAVWALGAVYLIWGTKRPAPLVYPLAMGTIASLLWLSLNEVPVYLVAYGIDDEFVRAGLLLVASGLAIEMLVGAIVRHDLGHRSRRVERVLERLLEVADNLHDEYFHDQH